MQTNELKHHGILGQKWGVRRYQNSDGTLTEKGKRRYGSNKQGDKVRNNTSPIGPRTKENLYMRAPASEIKKYQGRLTNADYKEIVTRLNYEKKISELAAEAHPSFGSWIKRFFKGYVNATNTAVSQINATNTILKTLEDVGVQVPPIKVS